MGAPELSYTLPRLVKGKRIETVSKGSTRAKEEAMQNWYVEFFFHDPKTNTMKRFRPTKNLNRIKDSKEKLKYFTELCDAYRDAREGDGILLTIKPSKGKAKDKELAEGQEISR